MNYFRNFIGKGRQFLRICREFDWDIMDMKDKTRYRNMLKLISPNDMTKEQLLNRVTQLEKHVTNLKNVIAKAEPEYQNKKYLRKLSKHARKFDLNRYNTRHVALKVSYLGWNYSGYVVQEDTNNTVEQKLFDALVTTRLIEAREISDYHRCGRTDKGVSAFCQVVSLDLRTNLLEGTGVKIREGNTASERSNTTQEIEYCKMLNAVLPDDIKILSWCPVDPDFSARFDCKKRTYKYYFPRVTLDIKAMQTAASKLIGLHDFRNLCKMDVGNGVTEFYRNFKDAYIKILGDSSDAVAADPYTMCELTIVGNAFLWHQIRCIVAVLFMVGEGKEQPEIIDHLLDVENIPRKPQYRMAAELPLVLFDCQFEDVNWIIDKESHITLLQGIQRQWTDSAVKTALLRSVLSQLEETEVLVDNQVKQPWSEIRPPVNSQLRLLTVDPIRAHVPLLRREVTGKSLEESMEYFAKRRKTELIGSPTVEESKLECLLDDKISSPVHVSDSTDNSSLLCGIVGPSCGVVGPSCDTGTTPAECEKSNAAASSDNVDAISDSVDVILDYVDDISDNVDDMSDNLNAISDNVDDISDNVDVISHTVVQCTKSSPADKTHENQDHMVDKKQSMDIS